MPPTNTSAQIAVLTALVEGIDQRMKEDREARDEERKETKATREAMQAELRALAAATASLDARMGKVEPVAEMVVSWRSMALGALGLIAVFGAAITGALKFLGITWEAP